MSSKSESTGETNHRTVLVVEDDWDIQDAVAETLRDAGFGVSCASNGQEALAYLREHPAPGAILLDLFMPVMNGWETARAIEGDRTLSAVPVIVMTASKPYWGHPAGRVLRKPIDSDSLVCAVEDAISHPPQRNSGA